MAGIRLSGLASGIDTETMIKQLMQAERAPVDRLSQKKQTLTWQRDAYREMNRGLLDLRTAASDMLLSKNYTAKTATSSDASKVVGDSKSGSNSGQCDNRQRDATRIGFVACHFTECISNRSNFQSDETGCEWSSRKRWFR